MSLVTTLPAPMTQSLPMVTPGSTWTPAPNVVPHGDGPCVLPAGVPARSVHGVARRVEAAARRDENVIPEAHRGAVQNGETVVGEEFIPYGDVLPIVAPEGGEDTGVPAHLSQEAAQQGRLPGAV